MFRPKVDIIQGFRWSSIDKLLLSRGYQFSSYEVASEMLKILAFLKLNVELIKIV